MLDERTLPITSHPFRGSSVIYVMARDQRAEDNHALLAAQACALKHNVSLQVLFVFDTTTAQSYEHSMFMIEGLRQVSTALQAKNISFSLEISDDPIATIVEVATKSDCGALFFDFSPLRKPRTIVKEVAKRIDIAVSVVDTHNIVPLWVASNKQEFAAHTMRRKIHQQLSHFMSAPPDLVTHPHSPTHQLTNSFDDDAIDSLLATLPRIGIAVAAMPGETAARECVNEFLEHSLEHYALRRNSIAVDNQTGFSPYLHFGQLSSLRVAIEIIAHVGQTPLLFEMNKLAQPGDHPSETDGMNALLEEMIVRKELADNYCFYNAHYDSLEGVHSWALTSLADHEIDERDHVYDQDDWEAARTHDEIWNAAQNELRKTGKIHGYMRMYWAKKILEWSASPAEAVKIALYLNDTYSIDGCDPNGYVGVLWSIAGLHDRPWFERSVFGKIRYMNAAGLRRKYDVDAYIARIDLLPDSTTK